eukprot:SAG22_NODE_722_length_7641_cov_13.307876_3_plen_80_part_00
MAHNNRTESRERCVMVRGLVVPMLLALLSLGPLLDDHQRRDLHMRTRFLRHRVPTVHVRRAVRRQLRPSIFLCFSLENE